MRTPFHVALAGAGIAPALVALASLAGCAGVSARATATAVPEAPLTVPAAAPAPAAAETAAPPAFSQWLDAFRHTARAAGITDATLDDAFGSVRFVLRVVELDWAQPEFTRSVWDYLDGAVSPQRIERGRDRLLQVRPEVEALVAPYGVPLEILVAIWGMESNYGGNVGDIPTIDALSTLGFDGRRAEWARGELLAALRLLQGRDVERAQMVGSWAGAVGQTQFMPSNYLAYAVDADRDGRRDLWASIPDVMASTANLLARSGWRPGQPWGLEVRLPPGFDHARADDGIRQPASAWEEAGVRTVDGGPLPALPDSSILLPAGAQGPAFLVGPNFRALLRYNNSTSYALAVGLLAQQLAGWPAVQSPWPRSLQALSRSQVMALQAALNARGFDAGAPDGVPGPATRGALRRFQQSQGLPADGYPTLELLQRLQ